VKPDGRVVAAEPDWGGLQLAASMSLQRAAHGTKMTFHRYPIDASPSRPQPCLAYRCSVWHGGRR
jgi:hypothetical protein